MVQTSYSASFQDKKTIAELKKEIELLKESLVKEKQIKKTEKNLTNYDSILLVCEKLSQKDKLKLITALTQATKKQSTTKNLNKNSTDKTEYVAARIFKTNPSNKKALSNTIKTMFKEEIEESEIEKIITDLEKRNFITIIQDKVNYI